MEFDYLSGPSALLQNVFADHAARDGEHVWCTFEAVPHTYAEINARANQLANGLRDEAGITKGDSVAVCMDNCAEYFVAMFAIHRLGAVYVPCSTLYSYDELRYQLEHAEIRTVITDQNNRDLVEKAIPSNGSVRAVIVRSYSGPDAIGFDEFIAGQPDTMPAEAAAVTADDVATLMYTSGTTERPKGVVFSHGNLTTAAHTCVRHFRWTRDDRYLQYFPLYHANGGLVGVGPAIVAGATIAMVPKFSASAFGQALVENQATFAPVNSTHVKMILRNPETEYDRAHNARRMMLGLTLSPEEFVAFEKRFDTTLMGSYGLTEALGVVVIGEPVGPRKIASAGRIVRGYTMKVVDDDGKSLGPNLPGEALIRSHQRHGTAMGYYKDQERTRYAFGEGWLRTGDVVRVDDDGFVWFVERKKDMIKRSGYNVAAAEVERVIHSVPGVREAAVVGTPDAMREEAIVAFVAPESGDVELEEDVFAQCDHELADYKRPQYVVIVDALPVNFLGKIERKKLRERALRYRIDSTDFAPIGARGPKLAMNNDTAGNV